MKIKEVDGKILLRKSFPQDFILSILIFNIFFSYLYLIIQII